MNRNKKIIVISAINLVEGGTLTILRNCLAYLDVLVKENNNVKVIVLVHKKSLAYFSSLTYIEFPKAKENWVRRIYYEYVYFRKLSKRLNPYLWFSLHDMTPNVKATVRVVYCHNPTPFYHLQWKDLYFDYKVFLFTLFYRFLYRINIRKNTYVVVQQNWLRDEFSKVYKLPFNRIIVAYPFGEKLFEEDKSTEHKDSTYRFFFPSLPRPFKNFELIAEACKLLEEEGITNFRVAVTLNGKENRYSRWVYRKYKQVRSIQFLGLLSRADVEAFYRRSDCLIFPSKLETWGLPISEFSAYNKPILVADLPYAYEAASGSKYTSFFDSTNARQLALQMKEFIQGNRAMLQPCEKKQYLPPFTQSWEELFAFLLK